MYFCLSLTFGWRGRECCCRGGSRRVCSTYTRREVASTSRVILLRRAVFWSISCLTSPGRASRSGLGSPGLRGHRSSLSSPLGLFPGAFRSSSSSWAPPGLGTSTSSPGLCQALPDLPTLKVWVWEGCGEDEGLWQPEGCREPLPGAWQSQAERPDQPSAFPPPFQLQTWVWLFKPGLAPSLLSLAPRWVATHPTHLSSPPGLTLAGWNLRVPGRDWWVGAELRATEAFARGSVNPPVVPAGSRLAKAGPFKGVGYTWSQPSGGCVIKLSAEGFYNVFRCVI